MDCKDKSKKTKPGTTETRIPHPTTHWVRDHLQSSPSKPLEAPEPDPSPTQPSLVPFVHSSWLPSISPRRRFLRGRLDLLRLFGEEVQTQAVISCAEGELFCAWVLRDLGAPGCLGVHRCGTVLIVPSVGCVQFFDRQSDRVCGQNAMQQRNTAEYIQQETRNGGQQSEVPIDPIGTRLISSSVQAAAHTTHSSLFRPRSAGTGPNTGITGPS